MLPADVGSIVMFTGNESTQLLGAMLFSFGGPVVHFAHGETLRGGASLAIRILSPLFFLRLKGDGPEAAMVAAAVAATTDAAALAWDRVPVDRKDGERAPRLAPRIALGDRRASVALAGVF
jgi:hypothetical protein